MKQKTNTETFEKTVPGSFNEIMDLEPTIDSNGDFRKLSGIDAIVTDIIKILMTEKGTYLWDPLYGTGLHKKVFEQGDDVTRQSIDQETHEAIKRYNPNIVSLINSNFFNGNKGFAVNISINYNGESRRFTIPFQTDLLRSVE